MSAETDALTNLPNRYRFEQYLVEAQDSGSSMAVMLFDVNFLSAPTIPRAIWREIS